MRTLIISCTTGEGHNSCAKAIKEVYNANNEVCEIVDGLSFISKGLSRFAEKGHILLYRHFPKIFDLGYKLSEKHSSTFAPGSIIYKIFSKGALRLRNHIVNNDYDTVICTHPFASVILTEMQNRYALPIHTAFVATDYTCCPSVKDSSLNIYFIPDKKLIDTFISENITEEKVFPVGIPIRQNFYKNIDKADAKRQMNVSPNKKHIVMMCGSMGCGPLAKLAVAVASSMSNDCELTVICGTNEKLRKSLAKKSSNIERLHICGFLNNMSTVLDSADLYMTKPGGISTTEAVAKRVPMLFVNTVAACETYNLRHFLAYSVANSGKNVKELTEKCLKILNDEALLRDFRQNLSNIPLINTSERIREILIETHPFKK